MREHSYWSCLFAAAICLFSVPSLAADYSIRVVNGGDGKLVAVEAVGLGKEELAALVKRADDDGELSRRLSLYVVGNDGIQLPALAGRHEVVGDALRFTPRFALRGGMKYQAQFFPPPAGPQASPALVKLEIVIPPPPPAKPTTVTAIYPSSAMLPENQLRFYIHFSAPMSAGEAYEHVKLLKADGSPVSRAFLEIGEELWDGSGQRLTLLFDPGRVKQGLKPREEFGPVLEAGHSYRLAVDRAWHDANGNSLAAGFEKRFTAGPAVETAVDHKTWKVTPPPAATRDPLVVRFPRPLDRALLMRMITVADSGGTSVRGEITVADEERRWEFRPDQPWVAGEFSLVVDTALEDSAGNNLARAFEIDVFDRVDATSAPELVRIPIVIKQK